MFVLLVQRTQPKRSPGQERPEIQSNVHANTEQLALQLPGTASSVAGAADETASPAEDMPRSTLQIRAEAVLPKRKRQSRRARHASSETRGQTRGEEEEEKIGGQKVMIEKAINSEIIGKNSN